MKKLFVLFLLLISTNLQAIEITGLLEAKISDKGLIVGPTLKASQGNLFYQISIYSTIEVFHPQVVGFKPSQVEYDTLFGYKINKDFTIFFRENCVHDVDKNEYSEVVNFHEITLRRTNYNPPIELTKFAMDSLK